MKRAAILSPEEVLHVVGGLVDAWCERRCLAALREVLGAYPPARGRGVEWGELASALGRARESATGELTAEEIESLERLAAAAELLRGRRR